MKKKVTHLSTLFIFQLQNPDQAMLYPLDLCRPNMNMARRGQSNVKSSKFLLIASTQRLLF